MKKATALLASLLVVACASAPKTDAAKDTKNSDKPSSTTNVAPATNSATSSPVDASALSSKMADTAQSADAKQKSQNDSQSSQNESTYFDFDKYIVKPEFKAVLEKQVAILKNRHKMVVLEGNADERGSEEYNMTLGLKRAKAVKRSLVSMGVSKSQIKVVSYGKDKPRLNCHEEKCWHENRRVDFVYK